MTNPSYISIPSSATPIPPPSIAPPTTAPQNAAGPSTLRRHPSFPPTVPAPAPARKFGVPSTSSITSNVSDMLLSSLLPPNLPKLPGGKSGGHGIARELSTRKEALSLPIVSNNFRRFVTKVGPFFWLQDRVEEVLYWRKPKWTWAWMLLWTFISFRPRLLLLVPSAILILILLHIHERQYPLPSLLGVQSPADGEIGTTRLPTSSSTNAASAAAASLAKINASGNSYSATTGTDGEAVPVVPPKEAESGVDYYMNLQAIQNLMGQYSDIYDYAVPYLTHLTNPQTTSTQTSLPLTSTHILLFLLIPSLGLPLLPPPLIPYLLLPLGLAPPLFFHPNLTSSLLALPRHRGVLRLRAYFEDLALNDALDDRLGRLPINRVEVWENERLDPAVVSKPPPSGVLPPTAWSSRNLRAGERAPWIKVKGAEMLWLEQESPLIPQNTGKDGKDGDGEKTEKMVLALRDSWEFIPGEEWKVDICGLWSDMGTDENGWVYSDDSWQNPSSQSMTEAEVVPVDKSVMPGLAIRRVTRRRRWWRRVYQEQE